MKFQLLQKLLDAGDLAARVEELHRASVAEFVGVERHTGPLTAGFEPPVDGG